MTTGGAERAGRVLFVCTANRCRSPFAERIASRSAAGAGFELSSAGLLPPGGRTPVAGVRVARDRGFDLGEHRSRRVDPAEIDTWDLVIGMDRSHIREVVALSPGVWPRAFTLRQLDRWLGDHARPAGVPLRAWVDETANGRSRLELIGADARDDIPDPVRSSRRVWEAMAVEMEERLGRVLERLS